MLMILDNKILSLWFVIASIDDIVPLHVKIIDF